MMSDIERNDDYGGAIRTVIRTALGILLLIAGACGAERDASGADDRTLVVFAASSLRFVLPELADRYTAVTGKSVQTVFGSSGGLATQIEYGAPADLFLAADDISMHRLAGNGRLMSGSRRSYAIGRLALVWGERLSAPADVRGLLAPDFRVISIANPDVAPYGRAAREALMAAGVWDGIRTRLVFAETAAQTMQTIRTGNADAGVVALALAVGVTVPFIVIDADLHSPLRQEGAVIAGGRDPAAAMDFLDFLFSVEARAILTSHGLEAAGSEDP